MADDLTQTVEIERRRLAVDTTKFGRRTCRRAGNKMLYLVVLLIPAQTALAHRSHDNPNSRLSGTAPKFNVGNIFNWRSLFVPDTLAP